MRDKGLGVVSNTEYYLVSDNVLAEFRDRVDEPEFWAAHWKSTDYRRFLERYENGYLGEFACVFRKYLPKDRLILEAGCCQRPCRHDGVLSSSIQVARQDRCALPMPGRALSA